MGDQEKLLNIWRLPNGFEEQYVYIRVAARRKDAPIMPIDYYLELRLLWNFRIVLRMREQD